MIKAELIENIKETIINFIRNITKKTIEQRIGSVPTTEDINTMIDGERFEISKQIAIRIGKLFDKTLYTKFKNKSRNS